MRVHKLKAEYYCGLAGVKAALFVGRYGIVFHVATGPALRIMFRRWHIVVTWRR